jgi:N-methylhydantoinase B
MFSTTIDNGTVYHHRMAGGGGWGDPLDRDPDSVAHDVRNEKVGARSAHDHYGVVLAADGSVDATGTAELRASRRNSG